MFIIATRLSVVLLWSRIIFLLLSDVQLYLLFLVIILCPHVEYFCIELEFFENIFQPHLWDNGTNCVHFTLLIPNLWKYTYYVIVIIFYMCYVVLNLLVCFEFTSYVKILSCEIWFKGLIKSFCLKENVTHNWIIYFFVLIGSKELLLMKFLYECLLIAI